MCKSRFFSSECNDHNYKPLDWHDRPTDVKRKIQKSWDDMKDDTAFR